MENILTTSYDIPCAGIGQYLEFTRGLTNIRPCPSGTFMDEKCHEEETCKKCIDYCGLSPPDTFGYQHCHIENGPLNCQCKDGYQLSDTGYECLPTTGNSTSVPAITVSNAQAVNEGWSGNVTEPIIISVAAVLGLVLIAGILYMLIRRYRARLPYNDCGKAAEARSGEQKPVLTDVMATDIDTSSSSSSDSDTQPNVDAFVSQFKGMTPTAQNSLLLHIEDVIYKFLPSQYYSFCEQLILLTLRSQPPAPLTHDSNYIHLLRTDVAGEKRAILDKMDAKARDSHGGRDIETFTRLIMAQCLERSSTDGIYVENMLKALQISSCWKCLAKICRTECGGTEKHVTIHTNV